MARNNDPIKGKRNRGLNKTWVYIILIAFAVLGVIYVVSGKMSKKNESSFGTVYNKANLGLKAEDKYLIAAQRPAAPEVKPEKVQFEAKLKEEEPPEEKDVEVEPEEPVNEIKELIREADRQYAVESKRIYKNPYFNPWMSRQENAFKSGISTENSGSWSKVGEKQAEASKDISNRELYNDLVSAAEGLTTKEDTRTDQEKFFEDSGKSKTLGHTRVMRPTRYMLAAGTFIPCVLITGVNTDLPGNVVAQVSEDVYDWANKSVILIPQGSRVFGTYNSNVAFGQKRAQIAWTTLTYPDGSTLDLDGMSGVDKAGYTGLKDQYNSHMNSIFLATVITASFAALGEMFDDEDSDIYLNSEGSTTIEGEIGEALADMGEQMFSKQLNRNPTVVIRPGKPFNIQVNATVPFTRAWTY